jgi:hypothetical protein
MSALSDMQKLIKWMRANSVAWSTLTVGSITVEGQDMKALESMPQQAVPPTPRPGMWERYGGSILQEAAESDGMTSVVEIDD